VSCLIHAQALPKNTHEEPNGDAGHAPPPFDGTPEQWLICGQL
jgi:hypothetical protein